MKMPCEIWSYLELRDRTARRILFWETLASQVTGKDGWGKENMTGRDVQGEGGSTQDAGSKKE